jgi:hypothetical protein
VALTRDRQEPLSRGKPVVRALGRAWVESDRGGGWTFREVANAYLEWLERVKGAKPATLRDHRSVLSEPGRPHRRGTGVSPGRVTAALGDRPAREVSTREIEVLLTSIAATGVAPRTVNKARALICSVFNYGMRPSVFGLAENPARFADRRAEPQQATLAFYSPEQVEAAASSSRCVGVTSTSRVASSSSAALYPATSRSRPPRAGGRAKCRCPTKRRPPLIA